TRGTRAPLAFLCIAAQAIAAPLILVAYICRFKPSSRTIDARRRFPRSTSHLHRRGGCRKLLGGRTPAGQSAIRRQSNAGESGGPARREVVRSLQPLTCL